MSQTLCFIIIKNPIKRKDIIGLHSLIGCQGLKGVKKLKRAPSARGRNWLGQCLY
jgi:hypothetical protein